MKSTPPPPRPIFPSHTYFKQLGYLLIIVQTGLSTTEEDILMVIDFSGRFNGEAFVRFESLEDAAKALERHKQKISNRWVVRFLYMVA